jgi:sigma-B regulation protein RsbU (phosphoserine phosphatase)
MFRDSSFEQETVCLAEGDTIIIFSDGLVEARDSQDREYGEERLIACVTSFRDKPIPDVLNGIFSSVQQFCGGAPQADDISALVARFSAG